MTESAPGTQPIEPSRHQVWRMFDRIAPRYDFLNHFLSLNRDVAWRKAVADLLPSGANLHALDLACGTADQLLALYDTGRVTVGRGIDPAERMIDIGRRKIDQRGLGNTLHLEGGKAEAIPSADCRYDALTMAFGIRNVTDVDLTLGEMYRVLKPQGRALILEFSLPSSRLLRPGYLFYLRHILPRLGGVISGDSSAYRYLNQTIESFPYGEQFCELMRRAGFTNVSARPLTFGVATIYMGDK